MSGGRLTVYQWRLRSCSVILMLVLRASLLTGIPYDYCKAAILDLQGLLSLPMSVEVDVDRSTATTQPSGGSQAYSAPATRVLHR